MSQSIGSLSATACTHHACGWRLRRTTYSNGVRKQAAVPTTAWSALGFTDSMTLEQAKARAKQLNAENSIKRQEQQSIAGIATRVERDRLHHSVFIPEDRNLEFLKWLEENTSGKEAYVEKQKIIWGTVKKTIIGLQLTPENFASNRKKIYRYLAMKQVSPSYAVKQISLMNQYGMFCARLTGRFYDPIISPTGVDRESIADAYLDSGKLTKESDPLDEASLADLKEKLTVEQHAWLHLSLWFGLRPSEIEMILEDSDRKTWRVESGETDTLWVYQPKLVSIPRHKRWKLIPILYDEQRQALATIISKNAEMPSMDMLSKSKLRLTRYAGRKGFTDLMLSRGQDLLMISMWMGHTNVERTQKSYKDRLVVHFSKVK